MTRALPNWMAKLDELKTPSELHAAHFALLGETAASEEKWWAAEMKALGVDF